MPPLSKKPRMAPVMKLSDSPKTLAYCSKEPTRVGWLCGPWTVTPRKAVTPVSTASSGM